MVEHPIVAGWSGKQQALKLDLSADNHDLGSIHPTNTEALHRYIFDQLDTRGLEFGWGGYAEKRSWYRRSSRYASDGVERNIHLGIDIWAKEATAIYAPAPCEVVGFADNLGFGNYGPTIIVRLADSGMHCLFGHLSRMSLFGLRLGMHMHPGQILGELGGTAENGSWPPHLHLQLIKNLGKWYDDYPGVCTEQEAAEMLANCPDPSYLLG